MSYSHMWSKYLRFVRSDRVRNNVMPYIAGGIAAVTCLTYSSLHTFFADYYVEWMRVLVRGIPMKMDPELETLVEEVREDVKKYDERAKKIRTFPVVGVDMFCIGSAHSRIRTYLGIPKTFSYKEPIEVQGDLTKVGDRYISFDEEAAHELAEALVLSDNAKRFAIARSMLQMCTFEMYFRQFIISLPVIIAYSTAAFFNGKLGFIKRPFIARLPIYALSLLHGFLVYVFPTDVVTKFYEREADKDACDLGLNYMVGGAEYYTKIMQRNAAIHELSVVGEKAYSVTGNEIYPFWRSPHLLTRTRRDYIESRIQEAQQADKTSFVETAST